MSLPAADELFRTTGGSAVQPSAPPQADGEEREARVPAPAGEPAEERTGEHAAAPEEGSAPADHEVTPEPAAATAPGAAGPGEHSGRETPPERRPGGGASRRSAASAAATGGEPAGSRPSDAEVPEARRAAGRAAGATASPGTGRAPSRARKAAAPTARRGRAGRRPSGRERHDEKITVYVSAEELMDLEHARLVLRGEHGLAVDRGRIVREAVAVVLADLEARGDASILVRRLRGR
ncbi:hypothetical protein [Streptomyces sp. JJ36]|uniref:hypothetical protein n=1 Tax=Streptomyces sp. JJ36 TaxID=2736645 RepID=UPI001F3258AD|nr:hypothetical protein [Streptomyces sp. JJ36]MCF6522459.1 hypothetical protein [Streptomyces sp. JJ36]